MLRAVYPDQIQQDSECLLQEKFTVDPTDSFSVCLKNQFCDIGSLSRQLTTLNYAESIDITN